VVFDPVDFSTLVTRIMGSLFEMVLLGLDGAPEPNSGANVYRSDGSLHFWHASASAGDAYEVETLIDQLFTSGTATFDNEEAFELYKEFQILFAESDLGLIYTIAPALAYAYYDKIGNGNIANPMAVPSSNARAGELLYLRGD